MLQPLHSIHCATPPCAADVTYDLPQWADKPLSVRSTLIIAEADFLECRIISAWNARQKSAANCQSYWLTINDWQKSIRSCSVCFSDWISIWPSGYTPAVQILDQGAGLTKIHWNIFCKFTSTGWSPPSSFSPAGDKRPCLPQHHSYTGTTAPWTPQHHSLWFTGTQAPQILQHHGHHSITVTQAPQVLQHHGHHSTTGPFIVSQLERLMGCFIVFAIKTLPPLGHWIWIIWIISMGYYAHCSRLRLQIKQERLIFSIGKP